MRHPLRFHGCFAPRERVSRDTANSSASGRTVTPNTNTHLLLVEQHFVFITCQHVIANSSFKRAVRFFPVRAGKSFARAKGRTDPSGVSLVSLFFYYLNKIKKRHLQLQKNVSFS